MSFFLPLLLAGALATPIASHNVTADDKKPRPRSAVIDTAAHRQLAADLVVKARVAAESGSLQEARAQLLVANTMLREAGGLEEAPVYALVYIDYALDRYDEAGAMLDELSETAFKKGDVSLAARSAITAAELYKLSGNRSQLVASVVRARTLLNDRRMSDKERVELRKRVG